METKDCIRAIRYELTKVRRLDKKACWDLNDRRQAAEALREMEKDLLQLRYCCGLV